MSYDPETYDPYEDYRRNYTATGTAPEKCDDMPPAERPEYWEPLPRPPRRLPAPLNPTTSKRQLWRAIRPNNRRPSRPNRSTP